MASSNILTGSKSSIGTSAVQLTTTTVKSNQGVQVLADSDNDGTIYVGSSTVTADGADATTGFPLAAGQSITEY